MIRRDPTHNTGWINWPTATHRNSGEGGMAVYLVVPEDDHIPETFVACIPDSHLLLTFPDAPIYPVGEDFADLWPLLNDDSRTLLAALCLGGSGGSWWSDDQGDYWHATPEDLTPPGRALHQQIEQLYGKPPILVTLLDT